MRETFKMYHYRVARASVAPADLRIVNARFQNHDRSKTLTLAHVARGLGSQLFLAELLDAVGF